jgi:hypothetical protein
MTYTQSWSFDPREIKRLRAAETGNAQPMYTARVVDMLDFRRQVRRVPVAFLDCRKRPSVADLWRVLRLEPGHEGDVVTAWRVLTGGGPSMAVLNATWTAPVRLPLRLVFEFERHREFLELAAELGYVLLASKPPVECTRYPHTIGVPVEGAALAAALAFDALGRAVS